MQNEEERNEEHFQEQEETSEPDSLPELGPDVGSERIDKSLIEKMQRPEPWPETPEEDDEDN